MVDMLDIYHKVGFRIAEKGFWEITTEERKKLIEDELKKYTASKIRRIDCTKELRKKELNNIELVELVNILGEMLPVEEHNNTIDQLTQYLINVAGSMQGWPIKWEKTKDETYLDNPSIEFNKLGHWDKLITHENESSITIFTSFFERFKYSFMNVKKHNKQIVMKYQTAVHA